MNAITIPSTRKAAHFCAALGWPVIPIWPIRDGRCACGNANCASPGKHPISSLVPNGLKNAAAELATLNAWWDKYSDANIAIATGEPSGVYVVDVDPDKGGSDSWADLIAENGRFPNTVEAESGGGGYHYYFRHVPGLGNTSGKLGRGIDTRGDGGYVLVAPSNHISGGRYTWEVSSHPGEIEPAEMPGWLLDMLQEEKRPYTAVTFSANGSGKPDLAQLPITEAMRLLIRTDPDPASDRSAVDQSVITALVKGGANEDYILAIFEHYPIGTAGKFAEKGKHGRQYLAASIANARAYLNGQGAETAVSGRVNGSGANTAVSQPFRCDDTGNAERFIHQHGENVRYVHTWKSWLIWNGRNWEADKNGGIDRLTKQTARSIYLEAAEAAAAGKDELAAAISKWARASGSAARRAAMLSLAQSEEIAAITHELLDTDPLLLNCQNGALDLRTCQLRPHSRDDMITRCLSVDYDPTAVCPLFDAFLARVMPDKDNRTYSQKGVGVSLTGVIIQLLLFLFGSGANGKSTFIEVLLALLGEYAAKTGADTLLMQDKRGIPNDVAALAGKRLVVASELPDGRRLNEGQVKDLTGGDSITARFLNQEFFTFKPEFTLWMYGNHKPIITGTDDGIWRRIRLIPFTVQIPEHEQDPQLAARLKAELPGILAWAVRGWELYQQEGMIAPTAVSQATDSYRLESDILGQFLADCTILKEGATVKSSELYEEYKEWANRSGVSAKSNMWLSNRLIERGFTKEKQRTGIFWHNLGLLTVDHLEGKM